MKIWLALVITFLLGLKGQGSELVDVTTTGGIAPANFVVGVLPRTFNAANLAAAKIAAGNATSEDYFLIPNFSVNTNGGTIPVTTLGMDENAWLHAYNKEA